MIGCIAVVGAVAGIAYATPIVGLASPFFSVGQHPANIKTHGVGRTPSGQEFEVELSTDGPASLSNQDGAYAAGGHNGWHSHPGMVAVTIVSGAIQWFDENCAETDYKAGDSWTEGSKIHDCRVDHWPTQQHVTEAAVLASEIEQLPDLQGYLNFASTPEWRRVKLRLPF